MFNFFLDLRLCYIIYFYFKLMDLNPSSKVHNPVKETNSYFQKFFHFSEFSLLLSITEIKTRYIKAYLKEGHNQSSFKKQIHYKLILA